MFYDRQIKYLDLYDKEEKVQNAGFVRFEVRGDKVSVQLRVEKLRQTDCGKVQVVLAGEKIESILGEIVLEKGQGVMERRNLSVFNMAEGISYNELCEIYVKLSGGRLLRCIMRKRADLREVEASIIREGEMTLEDVTFQTLVQAAEPVSEPTLPPQPQMDSMSEKREGMSEQGTALKQVPPLWPEEGPASEPALPLQPQRGSVSEKMEGMTEKREGMSEQGTAPKQVLPSWPEEGLVSEAVLPPQPQRERAREQMEPPQRQSENMSEHMPLPQNQVREVLERMQPHQPQLEYVATAPFRKRQGVTTKWEQLFNIYPHIRPFGDDREYLKMKPEDFVILARKYYPLISNSFLQHGYYNYGHVILTREMRKDGEHFYIGVPGNFYEKEKQVAVLFGFESFEGNTEPAKSGDFGYYMIPVEI